MYFFFVPWSYDYMKWVSKNDKHWPGLGNKWKNWDTGFKPAKAQPLQKSRAKSSSRMLTFIPRDPLHFWVSNDKGKGPILQCFAASFTHFPVASRDDIWSWAGFSPSVKGTVSSPPLRRRLGSTECPATGGSLWIADFLEALDRDQPVRAMHQTVRYQAILLKERHPRSTWRGNYCGRGRLSHILLVVHSCSDLKHRQVNKGATPPFQKLQDLKIWWKIMELWFINTAGVQHAARPLRNLWV